MQEAPQVKIMASMASGTRRGATVEFKIDGNRRSIDNEFARYRFFSILLFALRQ